MPAKGTGRSGPLGADLLQGGLTGPRIPTTTAGPVLVPPLLPGHSPSCEGSPLIPALSWMCSPLSSRRQLILKMDPVGLQKE